MVRTSPGFTPCPGDFLAHAVDADVAAFDQRSRRGARLHHPRVPQPFIETLSLQIGPFSENESLFLVAAGELFLQRRQFGERRIRIGRTVAVARCGGGRPLTVRRAARLSRPPLSRPPKSRPLLSRGPRSPPALLRSPPPLLRSPPPPNLRSGRSPPPLSRSRPRFSKRGRSGRASRSLRRRALGGCGGNGAIGRRAFAGFAEFVVATAAAVALLAAGAPSPPSPAAASGLRVTLRTAVMALAVAVVMRTALVGTATGPPDFDQHRLGRRLGRSFGSSSGFGRRSFGWRGFAVQRLQPMQPRQALPRQRGFAGTASQRSFSRRGLGRRRLGHDDNGRLRRGGASSPATGVSAADGAGSPDTG